MSKAEAPSIRAASIASAARLWSPASRISIMKGVHCQISDTSTAASGELVIQSGCGGSWLPNSPHIHVSAPLSSPYEAL